MKKIAIPLLLLILLTLGCIENGGNENEDVMIHLHVSNQSGVDDPVNITVYIDDRMVLNETCWAEDYYNWIIIDFNISMGKHEIKVLENNKNISNSTILDIQSEKWIVAGYFYNPERNSYLTREIIFEIYDQQIYLV